MNMQNSGESPANEMMLFSPLTINKVTLQNRMVFAPTDLEMTPGGFVGEQFTRFNLRRAQAGLGLIVAGAAAVTPSKSGDLFRINTDEFVPALKEFTDTMHTQSQTKVFLQILHYLKLARSGYRQLVTDLSLDEIREIKQQFVEGAIRTKEGGFDGVELHYAHCYTLASFLSAQSNTRTDMYGRTPEGRMRLACEIYNEVRDAVGKDYVVGCRMNADEFIFGANTLADTIPIALELCGLGLDYLSLSVGGRFEDAVPPPPGRALDPYSGYSGHRSFPWFYMPTAVNVYLAEAIRKALRAAGLNTPVMTAGKIPSPDIAEEILKAGKADMIGLCRPLVCDPEWPKKALEMKWDEIVPCQYGNHCYRKYTGPRVAAIRCITWPKGSDDQAPYEAQAEW